MKEITWNKKTKSLAISAAVYAVLMLLVIIICNNETITKWITNVFSVLAPIIIGVAMAYICTPILSLFENKLFKRIKKPKIRRALSMVCTYLLIALVLTVILIIIIPQLISSINGFADNFTSYIDKTVTLINIIIYRLNASTEGKFLDQYINLADLQNLAGELFANSGGIISAISNYVLTYTTSIAVALKNILFGLFISIYVLASKEHLLAQGNKFFSAVLSEERYARFSDTVKFTNKTFGNYIQAQLLDACLVAVECALAFSIAKMPYPVLLAFIIGITNIIPIFGPFIGGIPAAFIVFITDPGKVILFVILLVLIQQIDGNFVLPKLIGSSTGMSSLGVLCAITVMGGYFGIMGMILGVPCFVVIGELISRTINAKLTLRGMPLELSEYYASADDEILDQKSQQEHLIVRIVNGVFRFFKNFFAKIAKLFKRKK